MSFRMGFVGILVVGMLFFSSFSFALQAVDAEGIVQQGNFLAQSESAAVYKGLPQNSGNEKYWIVSITQNDQIKALVPIADLDSKLVAKGNLRTDLISANVIIQRLASVKASTPWLISLTSANKLDELANALDNEQFEVDIVANGLPTPGHATLRTNIVGLKNRLSNISSQLKSTANDVRSLVDTETQLFNVQVDTENALQLKDEYQNIFSSISAMKDLASEYDGLVGQYKNAIAQIDDAELDAQTKTQLIGLLSPLSSNQSLTGALAPYSSMAADNEQRVQTEFASLNAKVSNYEAELTKRLDRVQTYAAIYGDDASLKSQTGYSSLEQAANSILSASNIDQWKNQSEVNKLKTTWTQIQSQFPKGNYPAVMELVTKAKASVKTIKRDGVAVAQEKPFDISSAVITSLAIILGGFAVILVLKNLAKQFNAPKQEE